MTEQKQDPADHQHHSDVMGESIDNLVFSPTIIERV